MCIDNIMYMRENYSIFTYFIYALKFCLLIFCMICIEFSISLYSIACFKITLILKFWHGVIEDPNPMVVNLDFVTGVRDLLCLASQ